MSVKKSFILIGFCLAAAFLGANGTNENPSSSAAEKTVIEIEYPYGDLFDEVHEDLIAKFAQVHPEIEVRVRGTYDNYEDGTQKVLRAAMTDSLPDITFQGLNRFRVFVEKDIAQPLNGYIDGESNFGAEGFNESMFAAGDFDGDIYGLPFAVSLPIAYYNMDLVRAAGWDENNLPKTWDEVIELSQAIDALGDDIHGMFYAWQITGNWFWQSLVFSQGGSMLTSDESQVAFDGPEGVWGMDTFNRMILEGNQPDRSYNDARSEFAIGKIGCWFTSTSDLYAITQTIGGKFEMKTHAFPSVVPGGKLPAGGNGALIVTDDPAKQAAAWEVLKFWCGAEGAETVARKTGYMPPNKVAAESRLKEFYAENPNNLTAVNQLPLMTKWYAFPGENSLKITDVIYGKLELIATKKADNPQMVLKEMTDEVQALLP
ncbi:MAG: ABC transporter substrate-binding protein [Spirochaetales bacterium]|nr:ABC transporter substrate-binding protein [Spirochaetales bacterium]